MQMKKSPKSSRKIVWLYSAISGVCLVILGRILWVVSPLVGSIVLISGIVFTIMAFWLVGVLESSAKVVWTYGVICGVCIGILWVVYHLVGLIVFIPTVVLTIVALLLVGMLASKQTGRVRTGTQAGLVAGLTGGIIIVILIIALQVQAVIFIIRDNSLPTDGNHWTSVLLGIIEGFALLLVFTIGLGAGIGALGGLIGKRKAKVLPAGDPMYSPVSPQQQSQEYPLQQQ